MGMMGTLAKLAIGYAAARGIDKVGGAGGLAAMMGGGQQVPGSEGANPLAGMMAGAGGANPLEGLAGMMGGGGAAGANPMAAMMEKLQSGGLDLSAMMGGGAADAKGDGEGLLSSVPQGGAGLAGLMAAVGGMAAAQGKGVGALLDQFSGNVPAEAEDSAALMLRAMIQAAKSDGGIDDDERARLLDTVGDDADAEDIAFVQAQLAAPVDIDALVADVPEAQKMQVYSASLMAIRVDTAAEAQYLDQLAKAMGLPEAHVNALHMQMGVTPLYS